MRVACAQIVYATAENVSSKKSLTKHAPKKQPVSASTISVTDSVADSLADIAKAFIERLSFTSKRFTAHNGRTRSNVLDVLNAVEWLSHHTRSGVKDLVKYTMFTEVPFPYEVPSFPAAVPVTSKPDDLYVKSEETSEVASKGYVETWMPPFPSPHTYIATPVYTSANGRKKDASTVGETRRAVEKSLAQLKEAQRKDDDSASLLAAAAAAVPDNPFLAPPVSGSRRIYDEDLADPPRDLVDTGYPLDETTRTDSNMKDVSDIPSKANANEMKKQRVERILAEAGNELEDPDLVASSQ
ncbi:Transcription initiation factor TFIID subunit 8 [Gracilaria domingensis]|nr:Transcription initiation factor TFIID subunit 8 [Gracilaria domingensis]